MNRIGIVGGRVIDPANGVDRTANLAIENGRIVGLDIPGFHTEEVIDAAGKIVCPGLIDMHVHLREPGGEDAETVATGAAAAVAGGFTSVACIPNTTPPIDSHAMVEFVRNQAERAGMCNVFVVGCVSQQRKGEQLAELAQMVKAGAVAFSDDGAPVENSELMRRALEYCLMLKKPILNHCEVRELTHGGVMHEGLVSMVLGIAGMPAEAEVMMIARDVALAEATGGHVHIMHVSTKGGVDIIRRAKKRNVNVTTEVCPHHFALSDEELRRFDSNYKMSPPLRDQAHIDALVAGLVDGSIDVICTDHAPHSREKKMQELDVAPFGILGLETCLGLVSTLLVHTGKLDWPGVIAKMTMNPARILGLADAPAFKGSLTPGGDADVTIIDPSREWTVDVNGQQSKSVNSPFHGWKLTGKADTVLVGGRIRMKHGSLVR